MDCDNSTGGCSFLDEKSQALSDISLQSINCGESRPTYRSRKMSKSKTPSKNRLRERSSKSQSNPHTPNGSTGDRFIPDVSILNNEAVHFKLTQEQKLREELDNEQNVEGCPNSAEISCSSSSSCLDSSDRFNILTDNLVERCKILNLANQNVVTGTAPKTGFAFSSQKSTLAKSRRFIPSVSLKTLDAPDLSTDFYLNLIDWSARNFLAVGLANGVYMWNAANGEIVDLVELDSEKAVTSVKFQEQGVYLAVGVSDGSVLIFNTETKQKLRSLHGHSQRVAALDWNGSLLCSGSRLGIILTHETTARTSRAQHVWASHTQEVCALKWNEAKTLLASGSADSSVQIWSLQGGSQSQEAASTGDQASNNKVATLDGHVAAVKAVAWVPTSNNLIATGGGSADRTIKLWNINTVRCTKSVDTGAQVSQLAFNAHYNEVISSHGYATNVVTIWKYPFFTKVKDLSGHTGRILHMCMSPDGEIAATAADDETIRLWEVFAKDKTAKGSGKQGGAKRVLGNCFAEPSASSSVSSLMLMQHR